MPPRKLDPRRKHRPPAIPSPDPQPMEQPLTADGRVRTALEAAQEVIYQAWEAQSTARRLALARRALRLSPDCADAYVILAQAARDAQEARQIYELGVQAGERAIGPERFRTQVGHFWGIVATRPYMSARYGLAETLWRLGERPAAIAHLQDMLRLNPFDNQGVRYSLAGWLLAMGDDPALDTLLAAYPDEASAAWAYNRALVAFRRHGATPTATRALRKAIQINPHVPGYLLGQQPIPTDQPAYYSHGDVYEARIYWTDAGEGWRGTPGALEWLATTVQSQPATRSERRLTSS